MRKIILKKAVSLISGLFLFLFFFQDISFAQKEIELSLSDCLDVGLASNIDIKIAKIESKIAGEQVLLSESIFDTLLNARSNYDQDERSRASYIYGEKSITTNYDASAIKKIPTGTTLGVSYSDQRVWSDSAFVLDNPLHTAELSLSIEQPVLKNFFGYVDRASVTLSKTEANIADIGSLSRVENAVADIEKAYWRLVFANHNVELHKELLSQAESLYSTFEKRVKTGAAESTELYEIEANMRIRQTELEIAQNDLVNASNNLRLLLNEYDGFFIIPKNRLKIIGSGADLVESLNQAFIANRDYRIKKKNLDAKNIKLKMKENSLWPEVDLVATFAVNGVDKKVTKANSRLSTAKHPRYYAGVEFSFPLENTRARSEYNTAALEKEKAILEILQIEKAIATDIDEKVRAVNLRLENAKRWEGIREIQLKKYNEEEKKLKYGRSSSKIVVDYQNDLTSAAINYRNTVLLYYYALIDLENAKDTLLESVGVLMK